MAQRDDLPHSADAERLVLGSLLAGYVSPQRVLSVISPDDMFQQTHQRILSVISDLSDSGQPVDRVTVFEQLRSRNWDKACGGLTYLASLSTEGVPVQLDSWLRVIRNKSALRRAITLCDRVAAECSSDGYDPARLLSRASDELRKIADSAAPAGSLLCAERIIESSGGMDRFLRPYCDDDGVQVPWPPLATIIGALRPGQLIVVGARPSVGKTSLLAQICAHAALDARKRVAFFSLEMPARDVLLRACCSHARIDVHRLRAGASTTAERETLLRTVSAISEHMLISDHAAMTIEQMRAACASAAARDGLDLIALDYLQLMEASADRRADNRTQEISRISRGLKLLAMELRVPVVAAAQLNRAPESERRKPMLSDLRDSGSIEQDADVVIMLHRASESDYAAVQDIELYVRKHRSGPTGKISMHFHPRYTRFDVPQDTSRE